MCSKKSFRDSDHARRALTLIRTSVVHLGPDKSKLPVRFYRCPEPDCRAYHLTSEPKSSRDQRLRGRAG